MAAIVGQVRPAFHMDDVHQPVLDDTLAHFGLGAFTADDRHQLWRTWHALDAWPEFPAARWMNLELQQVLMVACHNFDLQAAHQAGMRTAFVRRPDEWGPQGPPDPQPNRAYDFIVDGFDALRQAVLARCPDR